MTVAQNLHALYRDGWRPLWCGLMHDAPRWPIHGRYDCSVCGRRYSVPWEEHEAGEGLPGGPAPAPIRHTG